MIVKYETKKKKKWLQEKKCECYILVEGYIWGYFRKKG